MSIFQKDYYIIPVNETNESDIIQIKHKRLSIDNGFFEDDIYWKKSNIDHHKLLSYLAKNFVEGKSWSSDLKIYGEEEETCLNVLIESSQIESIIMRVKKSIDNTAFLKKIYLLSEEFDLTLLELNLGVVQKSKILDLPPRSPKSE